MFAFKFRLEIESLASFSEAFTEACIGLLLCSRPAQHDPVNKVFRLKHILTLDLIYIVCERCEVTINKIKFLLLFFVLQVWLFTLVNLQHDRHFPSNKISTLATAFQERHTV